MKPSAEQKAIIMVCLENCLLREEIADLIEYKEQLLRLLDTNVRAPRPYEGTLWREIRHAIFRWRSMRRNNARTR